MVLMLMLIIVVQKYAPCMPLVNWQLPGRIKTTNAHEDFIGHITVVRLYHADAVEMMVNPLSDLPDFSLSGQIHLVQYDHIGESDLPQFDIHKSGIFREGKDLISINHAGHAIQADTIAEFRRVKGGEDAPAGSATPLASRRIYSGLSGRLMTSSTVFIRSSRI